MARARRRWLAWDRYADRLIKLSPETDAPPGYWKAYSERYLWREGKRERQSRRDTARIVADVVAAIEKRMPITVTCDACGIRSVVSDAAQMRSWLDFHECDLVAAVKP